MIYSLKNFLQNFFLLQTAMPTTSKVQRNGDVKREFGKWVNFNGGGVNMGGSVTNRANLSSFIRKKNSQVSTSQYIIVINE